MCDISREDGKPLREMPRHFPEVVVTEPRRAGKLLFCASFFLKPSTYCSNILIFRPECGVILALSWKQFVLRWSATRMSICIRSESCRTKLCTRCSNLSKSASRRFRRRHVVRFVKYGKKNFYRVAGLDSGRHSQPRFPNWNAGTEMGQQSLSRFTVIGITS